MSNEHCLHEREWGEVLTTLKDTVTTLEKVSKEVYGNGEVGLIKSVPRMEEKINNLAGAVASHTKVIATFFEFQATHNGSVQGKKELEELERIKVELQDTQRRDKIQKRFLYIMASLSLVTLIILAYNSFAGGKKQDKIMVNQEQIKEKQNNLGIPVVTNSRGQLLMLPDSTKILYFGNDSMRYQIKRIGK